MPHYTAQIIWQRDGQDFLGDRYSRRHLEGLMARNAAGKMAMTQVTLRPEVAFSDQKRPTRVQLDELHHKAHEECFIANSVTTDVRCQPVYSHD